MHNSVWEAIFHAVSIFCIPVWLDQVLNIDRAVRESYAAKLNLKEIYRQTLAETLRDLLHNTTYATTLSF